MYIEPPTATQNPENLFNHSARLVEVMQNTMGIHVLEAFVLKRNIFAISVQDLRKVSNSFARQSDMFWSDVNPDSDGAILGKLKKVTPGSAADLQNSLAFMAPELCCFVEPRILGVPLFF